MTCGHRPLVTVFNTLIAGLRQQRSVAVGGSKVQFEPQRTVLFVAQVVIAGGSGVVTITVNAQLVPSGLLVQVTTVLPTEKVEPDGGSHVTVPQGPLVVGAV